MLLLLRLCACFNFGPAVRSLTSSSFASEVEKRDNKTVYFVMFHGTHCPACQMSYPEFDAAARESAGMIKFGEVNTNQQYALSAQFRITAIPTFIVFHPNGHTNYMRDRSARSMLNFAASLIPDLSERADASWVPAPDAPRAAVLLSTKATVPPLWKGISCAYDRNKRGIRIGFSNNRTLQTAFGVNALPAIVMVDGNKSAAYNGKNAFGLIRKAIDDFFNGIMPPTPTPRPTPPPVVVDALESSEEFDKHCRGKSVFCVLEGAEAASEEFRSAAKKYRHDPFRFYTCGSKCPLEFAKSGAWIIHHRRNAAVRLENANELGAALDRVLDGGARFEEVDGFAQGGEL